MQQSLIFFSYFTESETFSLGPFIGDAHTSSIESMHGVFSKQFPKHPNIFDFIANLRQHESTITDKMEQQVDDDGPSQMVHEKDRIRDEKIKRYSELLKNKSISFKQFLSEMSNEYENEIVDDSVLESEIEIETESGCEIGYI